MNLSFREVFYYVVIILVNFFWDTIDLPEDAIALQNHPWFIVTMLFTLVSKDTAIVRSPKVRDLLYEKKLDFIYYLLMNILIWVHPMFSLPLN